MLSRKAWDLFLGSAVTLPLIMENLDQPGLVVMTREEFDEAMKRSFLEGQRFARSHSLEAVIGQAAQNMQRTSDAMKDIHKVLHPEPPTPVFKTFRPAAPTRRSPTAAPWLRTRPPLSGLVQKELLDTLREVKKKRHQATVNVDQGAFNIRLRDQQREMKRLAAEAAKALNRQRRRTGR